MSETSTAMLIGGSVTTTTSISNPRGKLVNPSPTTVHVSVTDDEVDDEEEEEEGSRHRRRQAPLPLSAPLQQSPLPPLHPLTSGAPITSSAPPPPPVQSSFSISSILSRPTRNRSRPEMTSLPDRKPTPGDCWRPSDCSPEVGHRTPRIRIDERIFGLSLTTTTTAGGGGTDLLPSAAAMALLERHLADKTGAWYPWMHHHAPFLDQRLGPFNGQHAQSTSYITTQ